MILRQFTLCTFQEGPLKSSNPNESNELQALLKSVKTLKPKQKFLMTGFRRSLDFAHRMAIATSGHRDRLLAAFCLLFLFFGCCLLLLDVFFIFVSNISSVFFRSLGERESHRMISGFIMKC